MTSPIFQDLHPYSLTFGGSTFKETSKLVVSQRGNHSVESMRPSRGDTVASIVVKDQQERLPIKINIQAPQSMAVKMILVFLIPCPNSCEV